MSRVQVVQGRIVGAEQADKLTPRHIAVPPRRIFERDRNAARKQRAEPAQHLRLVALDVDPDQAELFGRHPEFAERVLDAHDRHVELFTAVVRGRRANRVRTLVARVEVKRSDSGRLTAGFRHDGDGVGEPVGLDIHGKEPRVARLRLERHRAREPPALERIDRVGADIAPTSTNTASAGSRPLAASTATAWSSSWRCHSPCHISPAPTTRSAGSTKNLVSPSSHNTSWPRAASARMTVSRSIGQPTRAGSSSACRSARRRRP